jgi:hypothetical protein
MARKIFAKPIFLIFSNAELKNSESKVGLFWMQNATCPF